MSLIRSMFIGAAAGAVVAYFLKKDNGKMMHEISDTYSNGVRKVSDGLKARVDGMDHIVKDRIDRVASKLAV